MPNNPKSAAKKRPDKIQRENGQGDHEGAPHAPEEFDVMNPQKQIPDANRKSRKPVKATEEP